MAEEQRCEQSNAPGLCANNCGFFGNPATLNLCSKCYRDHRLKEQQRQEMEALLVSTTASAKSAWPSFSSSSLSPAVSSVENRERVVSVSGGGSIDVADTASSRPNRCGACSKRVGLVGFKCRCGITFCGAHRYPEQHACSFDFQALGKEAIAKANPVIRAAKLDNKI